MYKYTYTFVKRFKAANLRSSHWSCLRSQTYNFIKKETLAQVLFCEFCEIFKNTFFTDHL